MPPGGTSSLHLVSSGLTPLFRNRSVPSRRESLHLGPRYLCHVRSILGSARQTRRFLGGRQPLCGIGVTSSMLVTFRPPAFSARTADSRPGPGPADAHFDVLHAVFLRGVAGLLGGDLRGERRALARAAEAAAARGRPGQRVALAVGDRDDRVVERRVHVRDRRRSRLALDLLAAACRRRQSASCRRPFEYQRFSQFDRARPVMPCPEVRSA